MHINRRYTLWFDNRSLNGGQVCIFHDLGNMTSNYSDVQVLAWLVAVANPLVQVRFDWDTDYNFVWFNDEEPRTSQIIATLPKTGGAMTLCKNRYGYQFQSATEQARSGELSITADDSILPYNRVHAGIGMNGSGTFVFPARPNTKTVLTPAPDKQLAYWVSFGAYAFDVNDPVNTAMLNLPAKIIFPDNVYTMSAVLDSSNTWTIRPGGPTD